MLRAERLREETSSEGASDCHPGEDSRAWSLCVCVAWMALTTNDG